MFHQPLDFNPLLPPPARPSTQHHQTFHTTSISIHFSSLKPDIQKNKKEMAPAAKSAAFEKAVEESRKLKTKPTQDELLEVSFIFLFVFLVFGVVKLEEGFFCGLRVK